MSDTIARLRRGHGLDSYGQRYPTRLDNEAADRIAELEVENTRLDDLNYIQAGRIAEAGLTNSEAENNE